MNTLCTLFKGIDEQIPANLNNSEYNNKDFLSLNNFCPFLDDGKHQKCNNYEEIVISAFITLMVNFNSINDGGDIENDKLAQYAILWLCYKLNQKTENIIDNLDEIYNKYIKGIEDYVKTSNVAEAYNSCMSVINKKQNLMNMNIKETSKIYEALKILCKLYTGCNDKKTNYTNYSQDANDFVKEFNNLNDDRSITGNSTYNQILYNLFNDYNSFKNDCATNCSKCSDISTLPDIILPQSSGVTSPSSSIEKTLIP
ncbi:Plasmodium variant antigen protein Cir/Yir/Bir, putative, partial [Plasmodium chabaudi chabaudi]